ncbi:hypothetical protein O6H91_16G057400 [Diphasiastrum complanatum]|nr:hypothetical protein O6H91_16G057400 [Diphasiastrum complanatum]
MRRLRDSYVSCLQQLDGVGDMSVLAGGGHNIFSPTAAAFHRKPTDWERPIDIVAAG